MTLAMDFLVEIGTEELPPKALKGLMTAFGSGLEQQLREQRLAFESVLAYASPRRLAVVVTALAEAQADREIESKGPPVSIAFDDAGEPTAAALAFAKKCGVAVSDLGRNTTEKGEWLCHNAVEKGASAKALLPACVNAALEALPIPRRMRWGSSEVAFVRPVHWVVMLHGQQVVPGRVLGIDAGNQSRGHRFMAPGWLPVSEPAAYLDILEKDGFVLVDFATRLARIRNGVEAAAAECGGVAVGSEALYEEVAALNEWPVALTGHFDSAFLELPQEVISATLTGHQRYFSVLSESGQLIPAFITVANLESEDPEQVKRGNERVIQPRLADAAFFWEEDHKQPLEAWRASLENIVYQKGLGSLLDRSTRIASLAAAIAAEVGADIEVVGRAASLAKCDLVSSMVSEFPELQGTMGRYYAQSSGEPDAVALAIGEQYLPRFAGDRVPETGAGCCVALADKLDTLCGIFSLGKKPSGSRDPFGLRRSALGVVRIIVERELELDLAALIAHGVSLQASGGGEDTAVDVYDFIVDRLRSYSRERDDISAEVFDSVAALRPAALLEFGQRLRAVAAFVALESAPSLAAANKRIANILRKADFARAESIDTDMFCESAESGLFEALSAARADVKPLLQQRRFDAALTRLARLQEPVDAFFDDVMVMVDDDALRRNRLCLLADLREQFLEVADISRLSIGKA